MLRRGNGAAARNTIAISAARAGPSEQASIGRRFRFNEKMNLQIRAEFFNVFNRLYLPNPGGGPGTARTPILGTPGPLTNGFGFINKSASSGQRNGQLVARFEF
jgi:hypothetical protein